MLGIKTLPRALGLGGRGLGGLPSFSHFQEQGHDDECFSDHCSVQVEHQRPPPAVSAIPDLYEPDTIKPDKIRHLATMDGKRNPKENQRFLSADILK